MVIWALLGGLAVASGMAAATAREQRRQRAFITVCLIFSAAFAGLGVVLALAQAADGMVR